jgi:NAD+ synthase (glutamine-hydrolysing)
MNIALAQINPTIGDLTGNAERIRSAARTARAQGAQLLVTPELCVSGYPPKDMLLRRGFVAACERVVEELASLTDPDFAILVGHPVRLESSSSEAPDDPELAVESRRENIANSASLLHSGRVMANVHKVLLPNYDVFDERRYFLPGETIRPLEWRGVRLGVHICEDAWWGEPNTFYHVPQARQPDPVADLVRQGAELLINLSASPYESGKVQRRRRIAKRHVARHRRPFVFVNQVGGNDDLVFDGNSFVLDADGEEVVSLPGFETAFRVIETDALPAPAPPNDPSREMELLEALTLGLRDYMGKCGFTDCVLGLSGGIDSALAAAIAARAVGPEHVHGLLMPSRHSSDHSIRDAEQLARNLGIDYCTIPIDEVHRAFERLPVVGEDLLSEPGGLADQNLQARIRGTIVMTRSNRYGWMALATGNKSELAVGYCTLYGDMNGGFAVLSDLYKRDVYALSRLVNDLASGAASAPRSDGQSSSPSGPIPVSIIEKAPSAELAPDQFDQDSLPPYEVLDGILRALIDEEISPAELVEEYPVETVRWVVRHLDRNEFKRRQMAPGIKLTQRAFGSGRRMPMAARSFDGIEI